ncbi:MAG: Smr/MutS family protein [Acidobacteria bacterium]|nr:Smr/MutS family protein [Acidobacteriota bacterium]
MSRSLAVELEFDKVLELVAAHARTRVGRVVIRDLAVLAGDSTERVRNAHLTQAVAHLIEDDGVLSMSGVDEAEPWLEEDAPPPSEPRDLVALLALARRIAAIRRRLLSSESDEFGPILDRLADTKELVDMVAPMLGRDGTVADDASPELARLRREITRARSDVLAELEAIRRSNRDVVTDAPPTMRRDRYCLPVRSSARAQLDGLLLDVSSRGATSFVEPFGVVELNNRLAAAIAGEGREIQRILHEINRLFTDAGDDLVHAIGVLAELDAVQAKVLFGRAAEGRVVVPGGAGDLMLLAARHPLLDERLHALRVEVFGDAERRDPEHRVVPLDFKMPEGINALVISGPNAGGKTVVLKTIGLMVLMSFSGIPVPADEGTTVPAFDRIWCHIGDEQDVGADLSTFSAAMAATAQLLEYADDKTLVLFDELGAGTDPLEGAALGCALLDELNRHGVMTVVTTHLAAIALYASSADGMDNAAMEFDEDSELPTYTLSIGRPGRSRALEIASRMGVSEDVLERARELLGGEHLELDRWLRRLEKLERELEFERARVLQRQHEAERARGEAERELERLEAERRELPDKLAAEREELRRRAKLKLDKAIARLKKATEEHEALGRRRLQKLRDEALRLELPNDEESAQPEDGLDEGARVRLAIGGEGELRKIRGSQAQVNVSGKKLWVPITDLEVVKSPSPKRQQARVEVVSADDVVREINLIGLDSESAREELERFLDQALTAGAPAVRVVHGHGAGILRSMVADVCRSHPAVRGYRHPPQHLGGSGATEVELESGA